MFKYFPLIFTVFCINCIFFSCGDTPETLDEQPIEDSNALRIAVLPTLECLPFIVAEHDGFADSVGLSLQTVRFDAAQDADTAFLNHHVDGVVTDMVKAAILADKGDSVSVVMGDDWHLSVVTTKQSRISNPEGLREKIIAITRNSVIDMYLDKLLEKMKMESVDVNKPQINSLPIRYGMTVQNQYDGAIMPEPWATMAEQAGCKRLASYDQLDGMEKTLGLMFGDSTLISRDADIRKLLKAYNMAVDYINSCFWMKTKHFMELLGIEERVPYTVFTYKFRHTQLPSEGALSTARSWADSRKLVGISKKYSVVNNNYIR